MDKHHLIRPHYLESHTSESEDQNEWRRTCVADPSPEGFTD